MTSRLHDPFQQWSDDLGAWAIPEDILRAVRESPWDLPRTSFTNRARRMMSAPAGPSFERARAALPPGGTVLDVGCGAGAASLPLAATAGHITGVDESTDMLDAFRAVGGDSIAIVKGRWPDAEAEAPLADVVVCHHVLYNVSDLSPFVQALTAHARRRVVVEMTARHPMSALNPLWERLHAVSRPSAPTADDAIVAVRSLGLAARVEKWSTPASTDFGSYEDMLTVTARRLCLPPRRIGELDDALRELGVDPAVPRLGAQRDLVTIWWPGMAV